MSEKPDPRHWHNLFASWFGILDYTPHGEEPPGCAWTHHENPNDLEAEYRRVEAPFLPEIEGYIDAIESGGSISIRPEVEYFLGQRHHVIWQFVGSLSAKVDGWHHTIIPPCSGGPLVVFGWFFRHWWNHHGVRMLVDMVIVDRVRDKYDHEHGNNRA